MTEGKSLAQRLQGVYDNCFLECCPVEREDAAVIMEAIKALSPPAERMSPEQKREVQEAVAAGRIAFAPMTWTCEGCGMRGRPDDVDTCANCGGRRRKRLMRTIRLSLGDCGVDVHATDAELLLDDGTILEQLIRPALSQLLSVAMPGRSDARDQALTEMRSSG